MRKWLAAVWMTVLVVSLLRAPSVAAESNPMMAKLHAAEDQMRVAVPVRADGELTVTSPDGTESSQVILLYRPGKTGTDVYIEIKRDGSKALILSDGAQAFQLAAGGSKAEPFALDAPLAGSEFTREDLEPFHLKAGEDARISDESATRMTVSFVPKPSQYSLLALTIDTERKLPIKTLYYHETINNLVKMRRDSDHILIGQKWLPTTITMEDFKLRTLSTFTLKWSQDPSFPPELFDPAFLGRASGLTWPAPAASKQ